MKFLFLVTVLPALAHAETAQELVQRFPQDCQRTLKLFIEENGNQNGNFDAKKLLEQSNEIRWVPKTQGNMAGSGDNRLSAEYLIEEKQVTYSLQNLAITPNQTRFLVSFHECISAAGIQDEQYQITSSVLLKFIPKAYFSDCAKFPPGAMGLANEQLETLQSRTKNPVYKMASGGGTSVGGGGDSTAINFKVVALLFTHPLVLKLPELFHHSSLELMKHVLMADFEISLDANNQVIKREKKEEITVIRIPMARWLDGYRETNGMALSIDQWRMLLETLQILDQD
jgi:hypothetical protein